MNSSHKKTLTRLITGVIFLIFAELFPVGNFFNAEAVLYIELALYLIPYIIVGGDVLLRALRNIFRGQVFDENFLMAIATVGVFVLKLAFEDDGDYLEAVAVMLFYQVGELFQDIAVSRSRNSVAQLMDIRPDYANVERDGALKKLDPEDIEIGETIVIRPGERVPLDGVVIEGFSQLDTAALTGESIPRDFTVDDEIISGSVNLTGLLRVRVTKPFGESTVARILELVENAGDKKAHIENFITRFARYYTPVVCILALLLAVLPPLLFAQPWDDWVKRGLIFLVVSCPCALVISVPMSFFGGIGGASRQGVLVKGSNYLEVLSKAETIVFDKTGTLTSGNFSVSEIYPAAFSREELLKLAAHAESYSSHPIALSIIAAYGETPDRESITDVEELSGRGVRAKVSGSEVLAGNTKLMSEHEIDFIEPETAGTTVHVAANGVYAGCLVIEDTMKADAKQTISELKTLGISKTIMLTGDREPVARSVAQRLGIDDYRAELLPQDKVETIEAFINAKRPGTMLAFVGDGINDAPVLARADVGIAMGALGSDAAIEAADLVLMDDKPSSIALAVRIARKTMGIVKQNIWFALGIKFLVLILAACGIASMWLAIFADVGVAFLAILNAMRCLKL